MECMLKLLHAAVPIQNRAHCSLVSAVTLPRKYLVLATFVGVAEKIFAYAGNDASQTYNAQNF